MRKINLLGVPLDNLDVEEVLSQIFYIYKKRQQLLFTPNVDFLINAQNDKEFKFILNEADISIPDGKPLIWTSKFLGVPLKRKISGSSLFFELCKISSKKKLSFFLLGGAPGTSELAKVELGKKFVDVNIVGNYSPSIGFENNLKEVKEIIEKINLYDPDVLIIGLGSPKQEKWIYKNKDKLKFGIAMCLGATIDFAAGIKKMPPEFIKNLGLGWLWRLISEPKRLWKRYLIKDIKFFWYIFQQKFNLKEF